MTNCASGWPGAVPEGFVHMGITDTRETGDDGFKTIDIFTNQCLWLEDTTEFWWLGGTAFATEASGKNWLRLEWVIEMWLYGLERMNQALDAAGASPFRRAELGIAGMADTLVHIFRRYPGNEGRRSTVYVEHTSSDWGEAKQLEILSSAVDRVLNNYSLPPVPPEEITNLCHRRR